MTINNVMIVFGKKIYKMLSTANLFVAVPKCEVLSTNQWMKSMESSEGES